MTVIDDPMLARVDQPGKAATLPIASHRPQFPRWPARLHLECRLFANMNIPKTRASNLLEQGHRECNEGHEQRGAREGVRRQR